MKTTRIYTLLALLVIFAAGCNKPDEPNNGGGNNDVTVTVTTIEPSDITATTAVCGAEVTLSEGTTLAELGVCWSTNATPTVEFSHLSTENLDGHFTCTLEGLEPDTKYYVCAYAMCGQECYYGEIKSFTTLIDLNGHEYVDLDLPSGTLWATCNLGADFPEDYGEYFAWGETRSKIMYNWSTYQYCMGSDTNHTTTLTKYCNNASYGYNGFTDNLVILQPGDDAATVRWDSDWRLPTKEEWEELYSYTSIEWITQNGVDGRLFTASNGNSIFLPAAGYCNEGGLTCAGSFGVYWSSTLNTGSPYAAWCFDYSTVNIRMNSFYRFLGSSVRAVRSNR